MMLYNLYRSKGIKIFILVLEGLLLSLYQPAFGPNSRGSTVFIMYCLAVSVAVLFS